MLIELIMFSVVVMVGIALLVSDSVKRIYSIATSMKVIVRAHLTTRSCSGVGRPLASVERRCAIGRSAISDFRSPSHVHLKFSQSIGREFSKAICEATPKPLHAPKENYSIPTVAFEDARDKLPAHNRRVLSGSLVIVEEKRRDTGT